MSRRRQAVKRSIIADAKFNSVLVGRLVNTVMFSGKKNTARRIVYGAIEALAEKSPGVDPIEVVQRAVDNAKPRIETKARRVGGATYQVPMEVSADRQTSGVWQIAGTSWVCSARLRRCSECCCSNH